MFVISSHFDDSVIELEGEEVGDVRGGVDPIRGPLFTSRAIRPVFGDPYTVPTTRMQLDSKVKDGRCPYGYLLTYLRPLGPFPMYFLLLRDMNGSPLYAVVLGNHSLWSAGAWEGPNHWRAEPRQVGVITGEEG